MTTSLGVRRRGFHNNYLRFLGTDLELAPRPLFALTQLILTLTL